MVADAAGKGDDTARDGLAVIGPVTPHVDQVAVAAQLGCIDRAAVRHIDGIDADAADHCQRDAGRSRGEGFAAGIEREGLDVGVQHRPRRGRSGRRLRGFAAECGQSGAVLEVSEKVEAAQRAIREHQLVAGCQ